MLTKEEFTNNKLIIEVNSAPQAVYTVWKGKSNDRNPEDFIAPLLERLVKECSEKRALILDFRELNYMNSSTITPLIRFLESYKEEKVAIEVRYDRQIRWQELSFTALEVFESNDSLIKIVGDNI